MNGVWHVKQDGVLRHKDDIEEGIRREPIVCKNCGRTESYWPTNVNGVDYFRCRCCKGLVLPRLVAR